MQARRNCLQIEVSTNIAARQLVNHCHILLNGKKCNIPSAMVKVGDVVSLKEKLTKYQW